MKICGGKSVEFFMVSSLDWFQLTVETYLAP